MTDHQPFDSTKDYLSDDHDFRFSTQYLDRAELNGILDLLDQLILDCDTIRVIVAGKAYSATDKRYVVQFTAWGIYDDYGAYQDDDAEDNCLAAIRQINATFPLTAQSVD